MSLDTTLLGEVSTSVLSDALERCGLAGQAPGIVPLIPDTRVWGRAFTVKIGPHNNASLAHDEYMEDLQPGDVCVMDARGLSGAVWGDLRSIVAKRLGATGTIVDGAVRDGAACLELDYPVFARERTMLSGGGRVWIEAKQVPITIGKAYVRPGDLVLGDADGVVVVPTERAGEVLDAAKLLEEADAKMRSALLQGMALAEARRAYGVKRSLPEKDAK